MSFFSSITRIFTKSKQGFASIGEFFRNNFSRKYLIAGVLLLSSMCFAADDSDMIRNIVQLLNIVLSILTVVMTPAVIMAGWLLSPDWTMGDFFGLRPYFRDVWVLVSNIVYIIFAMMLLYMAVMQIFGGGEAEYAFKQRLPKFLVGILLVPFTWMIVSFTLSFANQAVAAVLSIPMGAIAQMQEQGEDKEKGIFHDHIIPKYINTNLTDQDLGTSPCDDNGKQKNTPNGEVNCLSAAEFVTYNDAGPFFIIMIYAYDIFRVQTTPMIDLANACSGATEGGDSAHTDSKECAKGLITVLRKFGTALITTIFFTILLVALCWVLLMRSFKLWIYIMFSPLFGLAYFTGKGFSEALSSEGGGESKGLTSVGFVPFFKLAMIPVMVSAVLSFGLLFIGVISNTFDGLGQEEKTSSATICTTGEFLVKYCITTEEGTGEGGKSTYTSRLIIGNDTTNQQARGDGSGEYTITFDFGDMLSGAIDAGKTGAVSGVISGTASGIHGIFAHIILTLIALVVIWMGIKAAVSYDEVTKVAFEPFAKFGESVGNFVQNIPSYINVPHPAFKALSPGGIEAMAQAINTKVATDKQASAKSLADIMSGATKNFERSVDQMSQGAQTFEQTVNDFGKTTARKPEDAQKALVKGLEKVQEDRFDDSQKQNYRDFKKAIETATPAKVQAILEDPKYEKVMEKLESLPETKGIQKLAQMIGANVTLTSAAGQEITINGSLGSVKGTISGDYTNGFVVNHPRGTDLTIKNPSAAPAATSPEATNQTYQELKTHFKADPAKFPEKAREMFGATLSDAQVESLKKYFDVTP